MRSPDTKLNVLKDLKFKKISNVILMTLVNGSHSLDKPLNFWASH